MPEFPGIRNLSPLKPISINQAAEMAKGQGVSPKTHSLVMEVASLLATDRAVRITNSPVIRSEAGTITGSTGIQAIDNPDDAIAKEVDLEKLLMYLQLENTEEQELLAQDRIESQKDSLATTHKERLDKIKETMEKMDKAAATALFGKIFGWLMAAVAVVVAVAACVATGGIAVGPCIGALLAVGGMVLAETGAMDKIVEALAKGLEELGMDKQTAQIVAQVAIAIAIMAATLAAGGIGGTIAIGNASTAAVQLAQNIQKVADIGMKLIAIGSVLTNVANGVNNYEVGQAQADLTETTKILEILRKQLEESEEELQKLLEMIQGIFSDIVSILNSETETQSTIANQMSQMA